MASEVQIFENGGLGKVRVVLQNNEYWFVAKDVAEALEYSEASMSQMANLLKAVPDEWKGLNPIKTLGGKQKMATLSEQGLYFFLARSDKPKALPFQKWIAGEVLPSIRKTGFYRTDNFHPRAMSDLLEGAKVIFTSAGIIGNQQALALDKVYCSYTGRSALAVAGIELIAPQQTQLLTPTEIGKHFIRPDGKPYSGIQANKLLKDHGLQKAVFGKWEPTQDGIELGAIMLDTGKVRSNGVPVRQLKWSSKILDFCARFWIKAA